MTITVDIPDRTVLRLQAEAKETGIPLSELVAQAIAQHYGESSEEFFARLARTVPIDTFVTDVTREGIYADQ
jgi:hypothetical protein